LKEEEKRMLEVFHHGGIREILGISRQTETKNHKLCSEEEVFEHTKNDEYSEEKGPEINWKGNQGREIKITTQIFPDCLLSLAQACRGETKITQRSVHRMCEKLKTWIHEAKYESKWNALTSN
jgi:hypothetical protein